MRYYQLLENKMSVEQIVDFIIENCQPFLKENPSLTPLYRGTKRTVNSYEIIEVRKDRKPLHNNPELQQILDNGFEKAGFEAKRSNSIFVVKREDRASLYGNPIIVIPIGEFNYTYTNHYNDMYLHMDEILSQLPTIVKDKSIFNNIHAYDNPEETFNNANLYKHHQMLRYISGQLYDSDPFAIYIKPDVLEVDWSKLPEILKNIYKNTDFNEAASDTEIMISCDKAMLIEPHLYVKITPIINNYIKGKIQ